MQPGRDGLVLERHPDRLDMMIGKRRIFGVAFALLIVIGDVGLVVLVVGPLGRAPMHRGHEEVVARRDLVIGKCRCIGLGLATPRYRGKGRTDIGHLLHPLADAGKIRVGFNAARRVDIERPRLIPVDAVGANDIVDQPALFIETAYLRRAAMIENRRENLAAGDSWRYAPSTIDCRLAHACPPICYHYRRYGSPVVNDGGAALTPFQG